MTAAAGVIRGLQGPLPQDESILWQGAPSWRALTRRLVYGPYVGIYFGFVVSGTFIMEMVNRTPLAQALMNEIPVIGTAAASLGLLLLLTLMIRRTTEYTITTHRVVMRHGIALSATLAIPHSRIGQVALRIDPDHTGDIPFRLNAGAPVPLHRLWPHVRKLQINRPEPMLRGVEQAAQVGALLSRAVATAHQHTAERDASGALPQAA